MKVGDLVKMNLPKNGFGDVDEWGVGVVVEVTERTPDDVYVFWSKMGTNSWEMISMLRVVNESR